MLLQGKKRKQISDHVVYDEVGKFVKGALRILLLRGVAQPRVQGDKTTHEQHASQR